MKKVDYWWWDGKDLAPFFQRVQELGSDNVRIRFNPETELLYVQPVETLDLTPEESEATGKEPGVTTFNFSHPCPPDCGNGG